MQMLFEVSQDRAILLARDMKEIFMLIIVFLVPFPLSVSHIYFRSMQDRLLLLLILISSRKNGLEIQFNGRLFFKSHLLTVLCSPT